MSHPQAPQPLQVHMIGNAHLDPVWQWRWPEGCAEAIGTCWSAVDRLNEEPGFIFTRGEALVYRWIEDLEPALFARIQQFVHEGRWIIVNGWWLQPDCNLPAGESFIRQALYGKAYFREKFGVDVTVGYNVDSFGHAGTLPMLLRHTGSDSYVFMRPGPHEKTLPGPLFDWIAPDGSQVTTFRLLEEYHTISRPVDDKIASMERVMRQMGYSVMCFYGVGNHGGGPTRQHISTIRHLNESGQPVIFSDPARYFQTVAETPRPQVRDELQMHAIGCYSAVSAVKQRNRRAEARLAQAEAASALALRHVQMPYPRAQFRHLWESLLFQQFHDILGGACIPSAMHDATEALGGIIQEAEALLNHALRRLSASIAPAQDPKDATFVVWNLTGSEQAIPVEYEPWLDRQMDARRLLDHEGNEVHYQDLPPEGYVPSLGMRRLLFISRVPAFGYSVYRFAPGSASTPSASSLQTTDYSIENSAWRLELDPQTGAIARLTDKLRGREVFSGPAHLPISVSDPSDTWSHGLDRFALEGTQAICERVELVEHGSLRASLRAYTTIGASTITSTYIMYADPAQPLEIRVHIDWHGKNQLLRLRYPVALSEATFSYEVPAGVLTRPADGRERPGLRWARIAGSDGYSLALANDAKYSYAAQDQDFYITALRSPVYAHHDPYELQPDQEYIYSDQGEQAFTIRLLAGEQVDNRAAQRLADDLLQSPVVIPHVSRGGTAPWQASLLPVETHSSLPTWLKVAEQKDDLLLRLLELEGKTDRVSLAGCQLTPYAIATLRQDESGEWHVSDGLES